MKFTNKLY